jgi:hypothetical protein
MKINSHFYSQNNQLNKIILILTGIIWIVTLATLIYVLVYAGPISVYRKNAFVIGIAFVITTTVLKYVYQKVIYKKQV